MVYPVATAGDNEPTKDIIVRIDIVCPYPLLNTQQHAGEFKFVLGVLGMVGTENWSWRKQGYQTDL